MIFTKYGIINDKNSAAIFIAQALEISPIECSEIIELFSDEYRMDVENYRDRADEYESLYDGITCDMHEVLNCAEGLQEIRMSKKAMNLVNEIVRLANEW